MKKGKIIAKLGFLFIAGPVLGSHEARADESVTAEYSNDQLSVVLKNNSPKLMAAVWGEKDGQNDIQWLTPQQSGNRWLVNMDVPTHHETGKYQVHVYDFKTGKPKLVTTTTFELSPITSTDIQVINQDDDNQTFDITFPKVESPAGITGVKVAVWSEESGQDDLHWYDAQLNGDQYQVHVDTANHKDSIGTYHIHAYASDNRRLFQIVGFTQIKVNDSNAAPSIQANVNSDQESVTVTLKHWRKGGEVLLPTWGDKGGQNDIQWYQAEKIGQSTWRGNVHLGNHMELGKYEVHAYSR